MTSTAPDYQTTTVNYANWLQRVGAYVIDSLAAAIPLWILSFIGGAMAASNEDTTTSTVSPLAIVGYVIWFAVMLYNRWIQAGKTGQSWGKKVLGIRLVGEQTGQPIGAGMAFLRDLAHIIDGVICYVGFLFPLWDAKRQTLADKIVKTVVVSA